MNAAMRGGDCEDCESLRRDRFNQASSPGIEQGVALFVLNVGLEAADDELHGQWGEARTGEVADEEIAVGVADGQLAHEADAVAGTDVIEDGEPAADLNAEFHFSCPGLAMDDWVERAAGVGIDIGHDQRKLCQDGKRKRTIGEFFELGGPWAGLRAGEAIAEAADLLDVNGNFAGVLVDLGVVAAGEGHVDRAGGDAEDAFGGAHGRDADGMVWVEAAEFAQGLADDEGAGCVAAGEADRADGLGGGRGVGEIGKDLIAVEDFADGGEDAYAFVGEAPAFSGALEPGAIQHLARMLEECETLGEAGLVDVEGARGLGGVAVVLHEPHEGFEKIERQWLGRARHFFIGRFIQAVR